MLWLLWFILLLGSFLAVSPPSGQAADQAALPTGLAAPGTVIPMPTFELPTPHGEPLRSASLQGKVVVVRFWATW